MFYLMTHSTHVIYGYIHCFALKSGFIKMRQYFIKFVSFVSQVCNKL